MESYSCVLHLYLCCHSNRFLTLIPLSLVVFGKSISACGIVTLCVFVSIAACLAFGFLCCCVWSPSTYHQPVGGPFRNSLKRSGWKLAESKMVTQCYTLNFPVSFEQMSPQVLSEVAVTACPPLEAHSFLPTRLISMFECIECCVVFTCFILEQSVDTYLFFCYHLNVSVLFAW